MIPPAILYHWTSAHNAAIILREGLRPDRSRGVLRVSWLCESELRAWARHHVTVRGRVPRTALVCLKVRVKGHQFRKTQFAGVFVSEHRISPDRISVCQFTRSA